ncbi:hypothetical protein [Virgisporangium ochraceum]|uniref:Nucleotide exchange factor GrpE n=1 Tax=Virgisporangium ochraceum TaxID=65505 RepID=A0A8J4EBS4_9ACTN|nr:hypothetical protein [Virgisporangium ochraceum]GIJ68996.1 hypothetical protein Voc01_039130 [Virgisporangium ochraceum]
MAIGLTPDRFGRDPNPVFMKILQDAGEPLTAKKVIDAVAAEGVARTVVSSKWATFQKTVVKFHPNIHLPGRGLYEWRADPVAPEAALTRLVDLFATANKVKVPLRDALVAVVRAGFGGRAAPQGDDAKVRVAQERQFKLDALQAVAELAGEVEELAYDSGDPELIVERLRVRVRTAPLEQLGAPGDEAKFDPAHHEATGPRPADGAAVTIVRPGYAWQENGAPVVLRRALVVAD